MRTSYSSSSYSSSLSIAILHALVLLPLLAEESVEVEGEAVAHPPLRSCTSATAAASSRFKHTWRLWTSHKCLFIRRNRSISRRHGFIDFRWGRMIHQGRLALCRLFRCHDPEHWLELWTTFGLVLEAEALRMEVGDFLQHREIVHKSNFRTIAWKKYANFAKKN